MPRRLVAFIAAAAVQLVALVLAHELVFLARYGSRYNEELVHAGHGGTWSAAVQTSVILAVVLVALGAIRLARLGFLMHGRTTDGGRAAALPLVSLFDAWRRVALRLPLTTVALLSIQENLERAAIGRPMPGPTVLLTPEYAGGLWIALAVGLAVGLVVALFRWRHRTLLARLLASRPPVRRVTTTATMRPGIAILPPADSLLGRSSALRAPPVVVAS